MRFFLLLEKFLERFLFASRWLQAPIYVGLVLGALVYAGQFFIEIYELFHHFSDINETSIMLTALGLVDISMVFNLLIVVAIGGYYTFVSKLDDLDAHRDKPEWLNHITSSTLKHKLIISLVSISGVHLLKTFINIDKVSQQSAILQIAIHLTFVISTLLLAMADKIAHSNAHAPQPSDKHKHHE
jgi:uncharacterized protein (TIGR00645 family)